MARRFLGPMVFAGFASAALSCSSSVPPPAQNTSYPTPLVNQLAHSPPPLDDEEPRPPIAMPSSSPAPAAAANREPELLRRDIPETVIAGRDVAFGLDVVDAEMDPVRVELGNHPEGAELDPHTLTVHWHVPRTMTGAQHFVVRITEHPGASGQRAVERPIDVSVAAHPPVAGRPTVLPPYVPTIITITQPDYLSRAAREWSIERVLESARDAAIDALPAAEQAGVARRNGHELFQDLLAQYAARHRAPRMDPSAHDYDHRYDSTHWHLVAVRPRANKAIEEIRLVYQVDDVPEPVFAMFRVRLFRGPWSPSPEVTRANNVAFTRLVHDAFWNGANLRPGIAEGRAAAVSAAVATLVRSVMTFRDPQNPALRMGVAAIPEEARLGGGSTFDAQGNYVSGNAWAFAVANVKIDAAGAAHRTVHIAEVPVSSFTFDIGENDAHDAFTSVCPPRYRQGGAGNEPGLAQLCERDGTVRIREHDTPDHWVATHRDSMNEHVDITMGEMLASVPLRDPRRRNFEESGMTCVQCHMRDFDDGVLSEVQVRDPRVHEPITPAHDVTRVLETVLPVGLVPRSPWFVQQETFQVCDLGRRFHDQLNIDAHLPCPEGY